MSRYIARAFLTILGPRRRHLPPGDHLRRDMGLSEAGASSRPVTGWTV